MKNEPLIIGHRGASSEAPENTIASVRAAVEAGADGVEFDVRLAKDGVPVVIHDATLKRTGLRHDKVSALTSSELGMIDVGTRFARRFPRRSIRDFSTEFVPSLSEMLDVLKGYDGLVYIELKCRRAGYEPLVRAVCDRARSLPNLPQIIVTSFSLDAIANVRAVLPQVQTAALFEPKIRTIMRRRAIVAAARDVAAHQLSVHRSLVTPRLIALAHEACMPVTVWTVDNVRWLARARALGIRALITNDPARMLANR